MGILIIPNKLDEVMKYKLLIFKRQFKKERYWCWKNRLSAGFSPKSNIAMKKMPVWVNK